MQNESSFPAAATDLVRGTALASSPFDDAATLLDRAVARPQTIDLGPEHRLALMPADWAVQDLSKFLPPPERIRQRVELLTLESFIAYAAAFKDSESAILADETNAQYEAVLDYHLASEGMRGTCEHIAKYTCPKSDPWQIWSAASGKRFTQVDFARFLEDNLPDITKPVAADLLQIVLKLQIIKSAEFESDIRLDNGQTQLTYLEKIRNSSDTKRGEMKIPDSFTLAIPVFVDGAKYPLKARLRYRLDEAKLSLWYELERPNDVFRAAVKGVSDSIRKGLEGVAFYAGKRS
jgi:uncharacterized protein YfdQ (DUF2303 family)